MLFNLKYILSIIIVIATIFYGVCTANEDLDWASDLSQKSTAMVWQNLKEIFTQTEQVQGSENSQDTISANQAGELYVFVSTSMPKPLLKSYAKEAKKYGGVLVFKGLPGGSFKELALLINELNTDPIDTVNDTSLSGFQIDDEAFDRFEVSAVPTIILSTTSEYQLHQTTAIIYDKITGNVGIKYALEQFGDSGSLAKEAVERLNG